MTEEAVRAAFERLTSEHPRGERRPGQIDMALAVDRALDENRHLAIQAGTGTGKSFAYLVPIILSGARAVVSTATKALQEQLIDRDLPFLHKTLKRPFRAAVLKGRSNYLCLAALADTVGQHQQGRLIEDDDRLPTSLLADVVAWSGATESGDRVDLPFSVTGGQWSQVSVGMGECPGRHHCAYGDVCFAEAARDRADEADVVVVNTHLYCLDVLSDGAVLGEHDVAVIDEAHALEDVAADTFGLSVGPARLEHLARACRGLFTPGHPSTEGIDRAAERLGQALAARVGQRVDTTDIELAAVFIGCAEAVIAVTTAAQALESGGDGAGRRDRLVQMASGLSDDLRALDTLSAGRVAWVEGDGTPVLRVASVDIGAELAATMFERTTVVLTSATLAVAGSFDSLANRVGLDRISATGPGPTWRSADVGSPFDYGRQALLYCAAHLPDPRSDAWKSAMGEELVGLVDAAGGRTLALFTSRRSMEDAGALLAERLPYHVLVQDSLPRPALIGRFLSEETSVLVATMGFWQGFDAPGRTCSLVVIDRLPFTRPGDPLAEARRQAATKAGRNAFAAVDLPQAVVRLAQGAGRLVRSGEDRGVVAVLDPRLATASYRWTLVRSLPPMRRTKDPAEVRRFLAQLIAGS